MNLPSSPELQLRRRRRSWWALALGLAGALAFAGLAGVNLSAQGPQYDELHQAAGAFTWLGLPPPPAFCLDLRGVCILNTTYSAAIKTNLYGLVLRLSGRGFVLTDWRWLGILMISGGILWFALLARSALQPVPLAVLLALLLSDGSLLLLGRFDWGPVALALVARLAMLGIWLRGAADERPPRPLSTFALAALAGLATFEKLSSAVLVLALAAAVLLDPRRRSRRHLIAAVGGLAVGSLPLLAVNAARFATSGELISLRHLGDGGQGSPFGFLRNLLSLGVGARVRELMLGLEIPRLAEALEAAALGAVCVLIAWAAFAWRSDRLARSAGLALACYLGVGLGVFLLPRQTGPHHWILATPFQYAAVALALQGLLSGHPRGRRRAVGLALAGLTVLWVGSRLPGLVTLERALLAGRASPAWDPSLSALGAFAARKADEAVFVASDWGVATQIRCFADGRPGLVHEPFWDYRGVRQLHEIQDQSKKDVLYLVRPRRATGHFAATRRIEEDLAADPRWREVPVEPAAQAWDAVLVRKFAVDLAGPFPRRQPADRVPPHE